MMSKAIRGLFVLVVVLAIAFYVNEHLPKPPVDRTIIVLHEWDSGRTIAVASDQTVRIELDTNPSTGYHWRLAAGNATPLAPISLPDPRPPMPGSGTSTLPFAVPYSAVPTTIKIDLFPPRRDAPPEKTFSVTLTRAPAR